MDVKLIMFREDGSKRVFSLEAGTTTLGRKDDCDIRIPLAVVSRRHAELTVGEGGVSVKDLGSSNGTFRNGERVLEEEENVSAGDRILIGPMEFVCQIDGKPDDAELEAIGSQVKTRAESAAAGVGTSDHVATSDDEVDPIAALEALASSADQTAIDPEDDE